MRKKWKTVIVVVDVVAGLLVMERAILMMLSGLLGPSEEEAVRIDTWDRGYKSVEIGMTEEEVVRLFGKEPEHVCYYGANKIIYFCLDLPPVPKPKEWPESVERKEDIPWIYSAAQILLDGDGRVRALTWNGEDSKIVVPEGKVGGDDVRRLDDSFFEQVTTERESATEVIASTERTSTDERR